MVLETRRAMSSTTNGQPDHDAALAQVLEDAEGCRTMVASMLLLDLPADVRDRVAACDEQFSALIVTVNMHLGVDRRSRRRQDAA